MDGQYRYTLHRYDGLCLRSGHVHGNDQLEAGRAAQNAANDAGYDPHIPVAPSGPRPYYYLLLTGPIPPLPADGSCPRCGMQRSACGGPSDPHE